MTVSKQNDKGLQAPDKENDGVIVYQTAPPPGLPGVT